MEPDRRIVALHTRYTRQVTRIRRSVEAQLKRHWGALPDYDRATIDRYARRAATIVTAAQRQVGALTDVYLTQRQTLSTGTPALPPGVPAELLDDIAIRGIPAVEVYRRAGPTVWTGLSEGDDITTAAEKALTRVLKTAATDIQLAKTHASQYSGQRRGVTWYRREIEGVKTCGLCIVASTQRYRVGTLMPIHPGCDCSVREEFSDTEPPMVIDRDRLNGAHEAIQARFGSFNAAADTVDPTATVTEEALKYRDVLITHQHGELGPVLAVRGHHFRGPADI